MSQLLTTELHRFLDDTSSFLACLDLLKDEYKREVVAALEREINNPVLLSVFRDRYTERKVTLSHNLVNGLAFILNFAFSWRASVLGYDYWSAMHTSILRHNLGPDSRKSEYLRPTVIESERQLSL